MASRHGGSPGDDRGRKGRGRGDDRQGHHDRSSGKGYPRDRSGGARYRDHSGGPKDRCDYIFRDVPVSGLKDREFSRTPGLDCAKHISLMSFGLKTWPIKHEMNSGTPRADISNRSLFDFIKGNLRGRVNNFDVNDKNHNDASPAIIGGVPIL
jgi:hypothetical protein